MLTGSIIYGACTRDTPAQRFFFPLAIATKAGGSRLGSYFET